MDLIKSSRIVFVLIILGFGINSKAIDKNKTDSTDVERVTFSYADDLTSVSLDSNVFYLAEGVRADELSQDKVLNKFKLLDNDQKLNDVVWLSIKLKNPTALDQKIILEIQNSTINIIGLYKAQGSHVITLQAELNSSQLQRPFKNNRHSFMITLAPHSTGNYFIYVKSAIAFRLPIVVWSPLTFAESKNYRNLIYGPYYGVLIFVLVFSVYLTIAFRKEKIYLYYSAYVLSLIILFFDINGFGLEYGWPGDHALDYVIVVISGAMVMFIFSKFSEHFLLASSGLLVRKMFRFFSYAFLVNAVLSAVMFYSPFLQRIHFIVFEALCTPIFFIFVPVASFMAFQRGFKPALFLIVAVLFLLMGFAVNLMRVFDALPNNWATQHALQIGNLFEILILTLGLAYWFKVNNDERQKLLVRVSEHKMEMMAEKERIAHDLHDNIGSQLTSLSLGLNRLTKSPAPESEKIKALYEHTNSTILELRDTIWVINKNEVMVEELVDKIDNLVWRLRQQDEGTRYELLTKGDMRAFALPPNLAINLFRIAQEAINNSIKHSEATFITVSIVQENLLLKLTIADNGVGFDLKDSIRNEHYGLTNMRKRAQDCLVNLNVNSKPGAGTQVLIESTFPDKSRISH